MEEPESPLVNVVQGKVAGTKEGECNVFRGIPFAAPPVGELRWRAPAPPASWQGVRLATKFSSASWQSLEYCKAVGGGDPGEFSEDCLYLNIWTPVKGGAKPLPVMVWLHGGGYTIGAGGLVPYDGREFASRGVVLVSINYRLGHLGFFAHPALEGEDPAGPLYNFALMDQIAALEWVRENIHAFGGDAGNITLFGESAGARSVLSLLASPLAGGLFHKAIVQSAYTLPDVDRRQALRKGISLARHFGLEEATAEQLRALPAEAFWALEAPLNIGPAPISGDRVLPEPMLDVFFAGKQHPMPIMIGSNSDEASVLSYFGIDLAGQIELLRREKRFGLGLIKLLYPGVKGDSELGRQVCRDMAFTTMGFVVMQAQQRTGQPCWRYYFDYVAEAERKTYANGTWHGNEVPYVFNTLHLTPPACEYATERDLAFCAKVCDYWAQFAREVTSESEYLEGILRWPACTRRRDRTMLLGVNKQAQFRISNRFMRTRMQLFKRVMKHHVQLN
ncbi:carboxylesterase/lipase family protein [Enterobacteriaceae bacterium H20N1]|uniref:Carboxylic ester hydrolase n=1 Tax=Dryocola boscaweniae TaxID=2925397 RepID=A0A9X3AP81_9ENTR|nr:carboxylesterase/lipase family protein [Dryocola boscaweniae]MCT4703762.1 carboxylesterase/lipase family protein [Dryocola boscaweniae]MCT4716940.1 carboxylesterase/lipase family protein [Dryocola boscaweniae]MCT4720930.1 carboxylesterase/lipase family protein [Dryocola boscaweniae]